jgi:lactate dehydrogenase-like 2-hydroxyacid dehydrogenase
MKRMKGKVDNGIALQLGPMLPFLDAELERRFELVRWFAVPEAERSDWLRLRGGQVRAVVTGGNTGCTNALIDALPSLGIIAINGVGFDKVDLAHAGARGVQVANTPDVLTDDVADLAIGLIISLLRAIPAGDAHVRSGRWPGGERPLGRSVTGLSFGIVGLGRIGSAIARRLVAFGPVAYTGRSPKPAPFDFVPDLVDLARRSDVLVLACAANAATRHLLDAAALDALGPDSYLVKVARGSVVDEAALVAALRSGRLAGAGLDVFENEPRVPEALRASERVVLTPHIGSATVEARRRMAELVLRSLDSFLAGERPAAALIHPKGRHGAGTV